MPDMSTEDHIFIWVRKNRGVCAGIARQFSVSHQFVRQVLYCPAIKSSDLRIEKALAEAGAPFMSSRFEVAQ